MKLLGDDTGIGAYPAWKEKNLDYEIETRCFLIWTFRLDESLEKKRTSITRLKHEINRIVGQLTQYAWKEKNLNYEIQTTESYNR